MTITNSTRISRNALAHLLMIAVVVLWGASFVLVKAVLADITPQWFNSIRMTIAFLCLALLYCDQWRQLTRQAWLAGAAAGACLTAGYFFQTQGLLYTSPTNSAFLTALVVVLVPLLASLPWLRPPGSGLPQWTAWGGATLAFLGVALLTTPAHTPWDHILANLNRGDLLTLGCALGFALHVITLAHATQKIRFEQIALLQIGFAMLFLTTAALAMQPPAAHALADLLTLQHAGITPLLLFALAVTGIAGTAAAFSIQTWAQQTIPATNIAVILTLEPVFAWLTSFAVLHERLDLRHSFGAILVLGGILATELLPRWQTRNLSP